MWRCKISLKNKKQKKKNSNLDVVGFENLKIYSARILHEKQAQVQYSQK